MEQLFTPHTGLMVWTALTFLLLVGVLARFAWKPILEALRAREESIKNNIQAAERSKAEAEKLRRDYEGQIARMDAKARDILAEAEAAGRRTKDEILRAAQAENERLLDAARKKLAEEERRLLREVRAEVAEMSLRAAEKILRQGLDKSAQDRLIKETLGDLESSSGK
ncbi:MAG TPA: F0F1 ATP synthase subunit B [Elusimicrobiota bacterium]|nr:F0F1 ATP synthase subunit B [Elusimicrobiota bacterium]